MESNDSPEIPDRGETLPTGTKSKGPPTAPGRERHQTMQQSTIYFKRLRRYHCQLDCLIGFSREFLETGQNTYELS